jgi:hypothetical protein
MSPDEYGAVINPIAAGVGVAGGRIDLVASFLFGVEGPASLPFGASEGTLFLFLLIFATLGGSTAGSSFAMTDAALKRDDFLEDITIGFEWSVCPSDNDLPKLRARGFGSQKREK